MTPEAMLWKRGAPVFRPKGKLPTYSLVRLVGTSCTNYAVKACRAVPVAEEKNQPFLRGWFSVQRGWRLLSRDYVIIHRLAAINHRDFHVPTLFFKQGAHLLRGRLVNALAIDDRDIADVAVAAHFARQAL